MANLPPRPSRWWLTILGVVLLIVPPVTWWSSREAVEVGALPGAPTTPTTPPAFLADRQPVDTAPPRRSGLLSQRQPPPANAAPSLLRIPAITVDARVVAVGIDRSGAMEIPADVNEIGWYRFGPAPGAPGTAVLAGHVDSRTQGRGAFFDLPRLDVGDTVVVHKTDGSTSTWEVVARRQYGKDVIPLDEVFTRDGPPRLALITCGGDFDGNARRYLDNVVVYAVPVG